MISPDNMRPSVRNILTHSLLNPTADFLMRPGKKFRARLVELGCRLTNQNSDLTELEKQRCAVGASIIESIHAGALIIDDIQDNSQVRRNAPTLHLKYGLARALNAGNWLYFSPLNKLKDLNLSAESELCLYRDCVETLANAHCGQALDIGMPIDHIEQADVHAVCMASLELKTGALTALALRMGGYATDAPKEKMDILSDLGGRLGVGLQMFDDAGNFAMDCRTPMSPKKYEDLYLRRPSWIWAFAAENFPAADYQEWVQAIALLPAEEKLMQWCERHNFNSRLRSGARQYLNEALKSADEEFPGKPEVLNEIRKFATDLENAYV